MNKDFKDLLQLNPQVQKILKPAQLLSLFDLKWYLRNVDGVFKRLKI